MTARTDLGRARGAGRAADRRHHHALETLSTYLGLELGLYQALNDLGAATEAEVAAHASFPSAGSVGRTTHAPRSQHWVIPSMRHRWPAPSVKPTTIVQR